MFGMGDAGVDLFPREDGAGASGRSVAVWLNTEPCDVWRDMATTVFSHGNRPVEASPKCYVRCLVIGVANVLQTSARDSHVKWYNSHVPHIVFLFPELTATTTVIGARCRHYIPQE